MRVVWYIANFSIRTCMVDLCRALVSNYMCHLRREKEAQKVRYSNTALRFQRSNDGNTCVYQGFRRFFVTDAGADGRAHTRTHVRNPSSVPPIPRPLPPTPLAHPAGGSLRAPGIAPARPIGCRRKALPPCACSVRLGLAPAPLTSNAMQAGFSLQRAPLGALSRTAPVRPCGARLRSKPSCFSGAPLRYAPSNTRGGGTLPPTLGARSLRSLVCLRNGATRSRGRGALSPCPAGAGFALPLPLPPCAWGSLAFWSRRRVPAPRLRLSGGVFSCV